MDECDRQNQGDGVGNVPSQIPQEFKSATQFSREVSKKVEKRFIPHPLLRLATTDLRHATREVRCYEIQCITKRICFLESSLTSHLLKIDTHDKEYVGK